MMKKLSNFFLSFFLINLFFQFIDGLKYPGFIEKHLFLNTDVLTLILLLLAAWVAFKDVKIAPFPPIKPLLIFSLGAFFFIFLTRSDETYFFLASQTHLFYNFLERAFLRISFILAFLYLIFNKDEVGQLLVKLWNKEEFLAFFVAVTLNLFLLPYLLPLKPPLWFPLLKPVFLTLSIIHYLYHKIHPQKT